MASIGDVLTSPESGYQRINISTDTEGMSFTGSIKSYSNETGSTFFNNDRYELSGAGSLDFQFYGTKFNLILCSFWSNASIFNVIIDGNQVDSVSARQFGDKSWKQSQLGYSITGLEKKNHTVSIQVEEGGYYLSLDAIDIDDDGYMVSIANIGDRLTAPESGWQRIDDGDGHIVYDNNLIAYSGSSTVYYNDTVHHNWSTASGSIGRVTLYFYGTKIRLFCGYVSSYAYGNHTVSIDGKIEGNIYEQQVTNAQILAFQKENLNEKIHKVEIDFKGVFGLDCVDIDSNGYMCLEADYLAQENRLATPVKIGDDTITSESDIEAYAETVILGERQLLIAEKLNGLYVTDGNGGYSTLVTENKNKGVLDLLTTDGTDLYFKGRNVHKIELQDGQYGYSTTFMNVEADSTYTLNITDGSTLCDQIVQAWEFEEGLSDVTTVAKTFDNTNTDNFFYDDNIAFTDSICKVKDEFELGRTLDSTSGYYETEIINKNDFIELIGMEVE